MSINHRIYNIVRIASEQIEHSYPRRTENLSFVDLAYVLHRDQLAVLHREELNGRRILLLRQSVPPLPALMEGGLVPDLHYPVPAEIATWMSIQEAFQNRTDPFSPSSLIGPGRPLRPVYRVTKERLNSTHPTKRWLSEIEALSVPADWTLLAPAALLSPKAYRAAIQKIKTVTTPKASLTKHD